MSAYRHANAALRLQVALSLHGGADPCRLLPRLRLDPVAAARWLDVLAQGSARWRFRSGRGWWL